MSYSKSFVAGSNKTRKKYTAQFKLDRALETIKNSNLSEISRKYSVSVNVLSNWRAQLLERGTHIFETAPDQENKELKHKIVRLEQMVGKKEVELSLIKNFSDFYAFQNTS